MTNINLLVFQVLNESHKSGYKMSDIGSGYGKFIGGQILGAPGIVAGHFIGKNVPNEPNKDIDEKKLSHRFPILHGKTMTMKNIGAAVGGAAAGALASHLHNNDDDEQAKVAGLIGAAAGHMVARSVQGYHVAKRLGYGKVGKIGATLSPEITSLTTPKQHRKD